MRAVASLHTSLRRSACLWLASRRRSHRRRCTPNPARDFGVSSSPKTQVSWTRMRSPAGSARATPLVPAAMGPPRAPIPLNSSSCALDAAAGRRTTTDGRIPQSYSNLTVRPQFTPAEPARSCRWTSDASVHHEAMELQQTGAGRCPVSSARVMKGAPVRDRPSASLSRRPSVGAPGAAIDPTLLGLVASGPSWRALQPPFSTP